MKPQTKPAPRTTCRRLLSSDLSTLDALAQVSLPAAARPSFAELHAALEQGELWGWWRADILICGVILLPLDAPCRLCIDTAVLTGIPGLSPDRLLLLWAPAVKDADDAILNAVAQLALERTAAHQRTGVLAAFPVRARAGMGSFFSAGFQLVGLRPLLRLCPCLLLLAPGQKTDYNKGHQLRLDLTDTRLLGRRLEEGWRGVALEPDGSLLLVRCAITRETPGLQEEPNEAGNSGLVRTHGGRS